MILPRVKFDNYAFSRRLDKRVPEQQQELVNINAYWDYLKTNEKPAGEWTVDVMLKGYQLKLAVPSDAVPKVKTAIEKVESPNINAFFPSSGGGASFYSLTNPEHWRMLEGRQPPYNLPLDTEGFIGYSIGLSEIPKCLNDCVEQCPRIVVFDRPVHMHADLAKAIQEGGAPDNEPLSLIDGDVQMFSRGEANKEDHGTQIAGIIATQVNRFGLVGINPKAQIISMHYDSSLRNDPLTMQDLLQQKVDDLNQMYVFASDWSTRDRKDPVGDRVRRQPGLWVVAAGDAENGLGMDIDKFSHRSDESRRRGERRRRDGMRELFRQEAL